MSESSPEDIFSLEDGVVHGEGFFGAPRLLVGLELARVVRYPVERLHVCQRHCCVVKELPALNVEDVLGKDLPTFGGDHDSCIKNKFGLDTIHE